MFLGAMSMSAFCLSLLGACSSTKFEIARTMWAGNDRGWLSSTALGAAILGVGMAVGGACPGMVLSQVGSGVPNSGFTLFGGFVGALIYGVLEPKLARPMFAKGPRGFEKVYLDKYISSVSFSFLAAFLGVVVAIVAILLEVHFPWKDEVPSRLANEVASCTAATGFTCPAWPPSAAGALIGLIQIPALLVVQTFIGSATSYQVMASVWMRGAKEDGKVSKALPYLAACARPKQIMWWQVPYCGFVVLFSLMWAAASNDLNGADGIGAGIAFLGGFLMLFGSRWGHGCTSGHGISGCALLTIESFITVPVMFGTGIATAFAWEAAAVGTFGMAQ